MQQKMFIQEVKMYPFFLRITVVIYCPSPNFYCFLTLNLFGNEKKKIKVKNVLLLAFDVKK